MSTATAQATTQENIAMNTKKLIKILKKQTSINKGSKSILLTHCQVSTTGALSSYSGDYTMTVQTDLPAGDYDLKQLACALQLGDSVQHDSAAQLEQIERNTDRTVGSFTIAAGKLADALTATSDAMAVKDIRYYLNGMLWETVQHEAGTEFYLIATDGHRLHGFRCAVAASMPSNQSIIPSDAINMLSVLLDKMPADSPVDILVQDKLVTVYGDGWRLAVEPKDGKFPDYRRVIPKREQRAQLTTTQYADILTECKNIAARAKAEGVRLFRKPIAITINNGSLSAVQASAAPEQKEGEQRGWFSVAYIADAIKAAPVKHEIAVHTVAHDDSSILIESGNWFAITMPMRR